MKGKVAMLVTVDPVSRFPPNFDVVKSHVEKWIDVSAVPAETANYSDRTAQIGGQWSNALGGNADTIGVADAHHEQFQRMMQLKIIDDKSIEEILQEEIEK